MKRSDAFPSKYVSKDDVETPVVWTIAKVEKVEMDADDGGKKSPPVIFFTEQESKPLILNNSNWMTIEDAYGDDSDRWTGKQIELFKDPSVMFGGKRVGGVRVRKPSDNDHAPRARTMAEAKEELAGIRVKIHELKGNMPAKESLVFNTVADVDAAIQEHRALLEKATDEAMP